jgi:ferredoxin
VRKRSVARSRATANESPASANESPASSWALSKKLVRDPRTARMTEVIALEASTPGFQVATFTISLPSAPGLGIQLVELAGEMVLDDGKSGAKLGRSLVLVDGLVEGGNAWLRIGDAAAVAARGSVQPGDTIIAVGSGPTATTDVEGASYDATVDAIRAACAACATLAEAEVVLVVKRIVRRRKALITAELPDGEQRVVAAYDGENLRMCMLRAGVVSINDGNSARYDTKGSGNCGGNGLCCTCVVSVMSGAEHLNERTTLEKQILRKVTRWRQSCRTRVQIAGAPGDDDVAINFKLSPRSVNARLGTS